MGGRVTTQAAVLSDSRSEEHRPSAEAALQKSEPLTCKDCLYPCPSGSCTNRSCHIVSALLTCDPVTDQRSSVFGSPQFRACPTCHNLMMHTKGFTVQAEEPPKPPIQEDNSFQKVQKLSEPHSTWTLPEKVDLKKVCPDCHTLLSPVLDILGQAKPLLQCLNCPMPTCEQCLYPCPTGACTNQSCHIVSFLLSCNQVTDRNSKVFGCPQFRACPECHSMMMHERGCKYVTCCTCKHRYCFICLRSGKVCAADGNHYWTLSCSVPSAPRQRFQK